MSAVKPDMGGLQAGLETMSLKQRMAAFTTPARRSIRRAKSKKVKISQKPGLAPISDSKVTKQALSLISELEATPAPTPADNGEVLERAMLRAEAWGKELPTGYLHKSQMPFNLEEGSDTVLPQWRHHQIHGMDDFKDTFMADLGNVPKGLAWFRKRNQYEDGRHLAAGLIDMLENDRWEACQELLPTQEPVP